MKFLRLGVLLIAIDLLAAQQPQPASIEGVVVTLGSGEPLADATIPLDLQTKPDPSNPFDGDFSQKTHRFAHSDGAGRFAFENVSPGDYQLIATRSGGYVPGEYGQRTPTGNGIAFVLTAGQRMTGIRLALSPTGSVSGRVYDRNGEPVGKAEELHVPVYYPGVVDAQMATSIPVSSGGTVGGIDFPVSAGTVPARHTLGRVISGLMRNKTSSLL